MRSIEAQKDTDTQSRTGRLELARKMETGFPSPASDHLEKALNLEELVVFRPSATFYVRAQGNAMKRSGIHDKDILIVDDEKDICFYIQELKCAIQLKI